MIKYEIRLKRNFLNRNHIKKLNKFFTNIIGKIEKIELLRNTDLTIMLLDNKGMKEISKNYSNEMPMGMFCAKKMTIYLHNSYDLSELYDTFLHEVGHTLDYLLGIKNGFSSFYSHYANMETLISEDSKLMSYVYIKNPQEFFAQSFSECFRGTYNSLMMFKTREFLKSFSLL